jgi:hypothetical protein
MLGLDYSFARPDPETIYGLGYEFVVRYVATADNEKAVTADEIAALRKAGLAIAFVWETTETAATQSELGGPHASRANHIADQLNIPLDVAIYYAVDSRDVTPAQVEWYFRNAVSFGGRPVGVYGNRDICETSPDWGVKYRWQVETWGGLSPTAHIAQLPNVRSHIPDTDVNGCYSDDFGQWRAHDVVNPDGPEPVDPTLPKTPEDDYVRDGLLFNHGGGVWFRFEDGTVLPLMNDDQVNALLTDKVVSLGDVNDTQFSILRARNPALIPVP